MGGANYGTAGQILTSNGTASTPTWEDTIALTAPSSDSASGKVSFDFTGISSATESIQVVLHRLSLAVTNDVLLRLGTRAGIETTGYTSYSAVVSPTVSSSTSTAGFVVRSNSATAELSGVITIARIFGDTWDCSYSVVDTAGNRSIVGGGFVALSGNLDRVRIAQTATGTFDGGNARIMYLK
jgi:hypothetical protein